jgi:hypothetical protein
VIAAAALLLALLPTAQAGPASPAAQETCTICHGQQRVELARGVHSAASFTCVACHGGVADAQQADQAHGGDFRALTDPRASVESCGGCHSDVESQRVSGLRTDQLALYRTSGHGQELFETGSTDVATCADCHGSHEILHAADPSSSVHPRNQPETCGSCHSDAALMERYDLPADAPGLYRRSVHGRAVAEGLLASPACSDCHGHHGALPPRVDQAEEVCGHCHSVVQQHYEASPHFGLDPAVQCVTCHGNHLVLEPSPEALVGAGPGSCAGCHADPASPARVAAAGLHEDLTAFAERIDETERAVRRAGERGLYLAQELGFLVDARGLVQRARSLTHETSREALDGLLNRGQGMIGQTEDSLEKLGRIDRDRRIFTAIFFVLTVVFAIMLLMYAREIRGAAGPRDGRAEGAGHGS